MQNQPGSDLALADCVRHKPVCKNHQACFWPTLPSQSWLDGELKPACLLDCCGLSHLPHTSKRQRSSNRRSARQMNLDQQLHTYLSSSRPHYSCDISVSAAYHGSLAHASVSAQETGLWQGKWTLTNNFTLLFTVLHHCLNNNLHRGVHRDVYSKWFLAVGARPLVSPFLNWGAKREPPLCKPVLTVSLNCDWLQQVPLSPACCWYYRVVNSWTKQGVPVTCSAPDSH